MQHVAENAKNALNDRFLADSSSLSDDMQGLLDLHNEARCEHNADPLVYSGTVEATAQAYAEELASNSSCGTLQHSNAEDRNYYGENLFTCGSTAAGCFSPAYAMSLLYESEVQADNVEDYGGHATQILWKSTTELGCAVESCILGSFFYDILVCHYNPAGNFVGQYLDEVELPSGASC